MKIVFCTSGDRLRPSSRTRAHLVADLLREKGYDAESHHIVTRPWWNTSRNRFREFIRNVRLLSSLRRGDVLYLHKVTEQLDFMGLVLLRKWVFHRGFVFDFDDAIFLPTWRRSLKARLMIRCADTVIVGSHFLQEYALRLNKNSHVLSAPLDTRNIYFPAVRRVGDRHVRIGWTGTWSHYENMRLLLDPLQRLIDEGYKISFIQLGGGEKIYKMLSTVNGLPVEYTASLAWDQPKEVVKRLQQFDIGVMPLQKTEWNRGKDGWKAKEYMGCSVATVLSNWGENLYIVRNGIDGLLAETTEDWYQSLKKLIENDSYRKQIGEGGRKRVETEYSDDIFVPKLLELVMPTAR